MNSQEDSREALQKELDTFGSVTLKSIPQELGERFMNFEQIANGEFVENSTSTTLYKLNNFNDVSWWKIELTDIIQPLFKVTRTWGHRLPINETNNSQTDFFDTQEEAQQEYNSQINYMKDRRGYTSDIQSTPPSLPMLAQEMRDFDPTEPIPSSIKHWESYALQPKLDGIRCIMSRECLKSRTNLEFTSIPHIELYQKFIPEGIKLDGELYIDNVPMNIIESIVMRDRPAKDTYKEVCYHVFDIIDTEAPFSARIEEVARIINTVLEPEYINYRVGRFHTHPYFSLKFPFKIVQTTLIDAPPDGPTIQDYFNSATSSGYEGCIIRNQSSPYEVNKRSKNLLKLKQFYDDEFLIISILPGKNGAGILQCETSSGSTFTCSFKGTNSIKKHIMQYPKAYIGKYLRVEHEGFYENGRPRCPVGIHVFVKKDHE